MKQAIVYGVPFSPMICVFIVLFFMGTMQSLKNINVLQLSNSIEEKQLPILEKNTFPFNKITTGIFLTIEGFGLFAFQFGQKTITLPDKVAAITSLFAIIIFSVTTIFGYNNPIHFLYKQLKKDKTKVLVAKT